ncbi:MAG TPA: translocation/assembly module TamB domain-containing protein [Blastocatellia bacterium]|nr:translocation/assembly module TamB domain-containing protein [Blastocatellia bacterium]
MRKKLLIGALSLLGIILILVIAAIWYVRSGRLDLLLKAQIIEALKDSGIRAEIGEAHLELFGDKVTLENIELYTEDGQEPLGRIKKIEANYSIVSLLRQEANITEVTVTEPEIWIEYDEAGRSNIDPVHAPPKSEAEKAGITFLTARFVIDQAKINYKDRKRNIIATVPDVDITFDPKDREALEDKINHSLYAVFNHPASVQYQGRPIENITLEVKGDVTQENASFERFNLSSPLGVFNASGRVAEFSPFDYEIKIEKTNVDLKEISRVFMPDTPMEGKAFFEATVTDTCGGAPAPDTLSYCLDGSLASPALAAQGIRIANLNINNLHVASMGSLDKYTATADVSTGAVSGQGLNISSIQLSDADVSGEGEDFEVSGALNLPSLKSGKINVSGLRGSLSADQQSVTLSNFTASTLGGSVTGSATVAYSGGQSRVAVQFRSIDLSQAASLAAAKNVDVRGTANGTAQLSFPGMNYQAATGRINATFDAAISPPDSTTESAPAKGEVSLIATGRGFNVQRAYVRSASSDITATGSVGWNGAANLDVNFKSDDMAEVQRVIDTFGLIPDDIKQEYEIALAGTGAFAGRVQGNLSNPNLTGHLSLSNIQAHNETVGSFEGDIAYSPSAVRVENASLVRPDGSRADFDVNAPLSGENNISLKANVQNFDLPSIVRAVSPGLADFIGSGTVTGTVDLRGLPGARTTEGTADISLSAGEFNVPQEEEGKEPKKISVPVFTGKLTLANSVVSVQNLQLQTGDSTISGQGSFNLDTYEYSINAEGKNIDLSQVSAAASDTVRITGTADLTIIGQGKWDEWSDINVNTTIQGKNVMLNGRELGDAKLVAYTENGLVKLEATANVLDQPRTLAATIDLRDRKNLPISASIEFTDTELGPYLGLVSPELSGITGVATGTIKLDGPLNEPDQIQAVATLTRLEFGGQIAGGQQYTIRNQGNIILSASPKQVTLESVTFVGEGTSVTLGGTLARDPDTRSSLTVNGEINLRFLSSFTDLFFATGVARVEASIAGTLDSPQLLGTVNLREVGLRVVDFPLSVARGNGTIRFTSNQAVIENFTASTPGGGTISVAGGAALAGLAPDRWRLEVNADQVGVEYPRETQTVIDADLALQGNRRVQVLSGNVNVRRAAYTRDITLDELITGGGPLSEGFLDVGPGGGGGAVAGPNITLDIRIEADNTLVIRNNLADAVGSAYITLRGGIDNPVPSGRIVLSRGTLQFRNDRHELVRGLITLPPRRGAEPIIDFESEADISGYRISISFSGTPSKLETTLRSEPELPERDIISLVLTGNVTGDQSTYAAAKQTGLGLAQSILAASLSETLQRGTQRLFGLSRFSIDPLIVGRGNDPTARVTLGQQITKNLTITYSQNLTSGPSGIDRIVLVEYRLSNRFSVVGFRNDRGELGFDVRVRKRF